jgi:acyl-CoA dehydrogenase
MTINLGVPRKFGQLITHANRVASEVFRSNSRKYDLAEHEYPKELDLLAAVIDGMNEGGALSGAGAGAVGGGVGGGVGAPNSNGSSASDPGNSDGGRGRNRNGSNMASLLGLIELSWGDVGLMLAMPRQGLGQAAIAAVAGEEQLRRFGGKWAAMAITEPEAGSDSAAIRTTARYDEQSDEYVLRGEKIFVTSGERAELIVVWATLDREQRRGAVRAFVVERDNPGLKLDRLEHKLGIRASDTANFVLDDCRVPKENLLGSPEIETAGGFAGAMQTFDNTRPLVAGMAIGVARVSGPDPRAADRGTDRDRLLRAAARPERRGLGVHRDGGRLRVCAAAGASGRVDGRQPQAELAPGLDGQGQGRPHRDRHRAALRGAVREHRLRRGRGAREMGAGREDPRHLRGHPADPAARRLPPAARQDLRAAEMITDRLASR